MQCSVSQITLVAFFLTPFLVYQKGGKRELSLAVPQGGVLDNAASRHHPELPVQSSPSVCGCSCHTSVHLINPSGAEIVLRPLGQTSSAEMVLRKKV